MIKYQLLLHIRTDATSVLMWLLLPLACHTAAAQGNPYAMIGPVPMVEYAMPFERMPRLVNADTTGDTAAMLIDGYGGKIYYVNAADSILGTAELPEDAVLMWLSVDPLLDKYPGVSPYAYCLWNPMRYVDPDGMEIDDYFSKTGVYLGYDNAKTDNVRIIDEEQHVVDHRGGTFIFDYEYENSALMRQFNHSSWLRCRPEFRRSVVDYGRKVSTLPPFVLDFWDPYTNPFE